MAFSPKEIKKIQDGKIVNDNNKDYKTIGGKTTIDKVFLLSIDEARKYFDTDRERAAEITKFAFKSLVKCTSEESAKASLYENNKDYWLRTPGNHQAGASRVNSDGWIYSFGINVSDNRVGFRPAIWVKP